MKYFKKHSEVDQWGPGDSRLLYLSFWFLPIANKYSSRFRLKWPDIFGKLDHDKITFYWDKLDIEKKGRLAAEKWIIPKKKRNELWKKYETVIAEIDSLVEEIEGLPQKQLVQKLGTLGKRVYKSMTDYWVITLVPEIANFAAQSWLEPRLEKYVPEDKIDEVLEVLLAPESLSFHQQGELELLKIINSNQKPEENQRKLKKFVNQWYWVENSYHTSKSLTKKYFLNAVKNLSKKAKLKKQKQLAGYSREQKKRVVKIAKTYKLPKTLVAAARALAFSIWWQDHRKAKSWWVHSKIDILSKLAAKKHGLSFDDVMHYTAEEWLKLLDEGKKVNQKKIRQRKALTFIYLKDKKAEVLEGPRARKKLKAVLDEVKALSKQQDKVKGLVVSARGKIVTGTARVLTTPRESKGFKEGEILVAPFTSPDYIVIMRKAKAIVTDIGGLMSHAAVVSRELGIPCIVGTKNSTRSIKTGDRIKIDTNLGVVAKL